MREFPDIIFVPSWWMEYGMAAERSVLGSKIKFWQDNTEYYSLYRLEDIDSLPEYEVEADGFAALTLHRIGIARSRRTGRRWSSTSPRRRRASLRRCRGQRNGGAPALQPRLPGVGHRGAGAAARPVPPIAAAARRGARIGHAAAEKVAAGGVRPDPAHRPAPPPH